MKRFDFRFKALKKVKEYELEKAQEILDEAVAYRIRCEERVTQTEQEIQDLLGQLSDLSSQESLQLHLIMNLRNFIAVRRLYLARQNNDREKAFEEEEERRMEYLEARTEKRKVELIEEKDMAEYKKEYLKYESRILDEISHRKKGTD